ncbi:MAG: redoxin domain-containing protein [Balneolaceae bacterium]|nr:redoxin domain-containing protein [Balneolaceae bacterium]
MNKDSIKLQAGDKTPEFRLQNTKGEHISLKDLLSQDPQVVLLFFPLAFSGTCTKELCTTRDNMKLYNSLNANIVGISIDSFFTLKEFKKAENLNFPLLSDFNKEASKAYGVLNHDFYGMRGVSKRSVFVINSDGIIKYVEVLDDDDKLPDFEALHSALQ